MSLFEELEGLGVNVSEGMNRLGGNEALYTNGREPVDHSGLCRIHDDYGYAARRKAGGGPCGPDGDSAGAKADYRMHREEYAVVTVCCCGGAHG